MTTSSIVTETHEIEQPQQVLKEASLLFHKQAAYERTQKCDSMPKKIKRNLCEAKQEIQI